MKPSEVLRPLQDAYEAACSACGLDNETIDAPWKAWNKRQYAILDDHAERLRAAEAYLTEHATGKARSTKYGIAEAARTYLSTLSPKPASDPAETWPWNAPQPDDCANCGCRKSGHHPIGCEGSGGNCRCPGYKAKSPLSPPSETWPKWVLVKAHGGGFCGVYRWTSETTGAYINKEGRCECKLNESDVRGYAPNSGNTTTHAKVIEAIPAIAKDFPLSPPAPSIGDNDSWSSPSSSSSSTSSSSSPPQQGSTTTGLTDPANVGEDAREAPISYGEIYAALRMLEVFAPADPLVTRVQVGLGKVASHFHGGLNQIGHEMAVDVDRVEKLLSPQVASREKRIAELEKAFAPLEKDRDDWKHEYEMFMNAWARELGCVRQKTHLIDTLVVGTQELKARAEAAERERDSLRAKLDKIAEDIK